MRSMVPRQLAGRRLHAGRRGSKNQSAVLHQRRADQGDLVLRSVRYQGDQAETPTLENFVDFFDRLPDGWDSGKQAGPSDIVALKEQATAEAKTFHDQARVKKQEAARWEESGSSNCASPNQLTVTMPPWRRRTRLRR